MGQRRAVAAVSVKPRCFKLEPRQESTSSTSPPPSSPDVSRNTSEITAIRLSKNWELPQRLKPGRKPKSRRADVLVGKNGSSKIKEALTSNHKDQADCGNKVIKDCPGKSGDEGNASGDENGVDSVEKRRKQNRDAQRAYRERRTTRIQVLEEKVEMLQNLVDDWQKKYKRLESEFSDTKENLHKSLALNNKLQKASPLLVDAQVQQQQQQQLKNRHENSISIVEMIENFKPMDAVNLKKRKAEETSHVSTIPVNQSLSEIDITNNYQYASNRQFRSRNSSLDGHINSPLSSCGSSNNAYMGNGSKKVRCGGKQETTKAVKCYGVETGITPPLSLGCCSCQKIGSESEELVTRCCLDREIDSEDKPITREDGSWVPGSCKQCRSDPHSKSFCQSLSNGRTSSSISSNSALSGDANEQRTDPDYSLVKLPEINSSKNAQTNSTSEIKKYLPISYTYQKIRQHMQKNKNDQEQLSKEDSSSVSMILENVATGLHVHGQKVELQSIKDALHKMDKNVLE
ncbi:hypothetical protein SKDZ_15G1260 [Saccharomyces kudriavzevii ZP591]|nr:hypothetical protein SKDZ_15G1260 [Saccharomyces kudriavzevii ZP591]